MRLAFRNSGICLALSIICLFIFFEWSITVDRPDDSSWSPNPAPTPSPIPRIPRIIHQSWRVANKIPGSTVKYVQSWVQNNPTWQYFFWTDESNEDLIATEFPEFSDYYRRLKPVSKADFLRFVYLYVFGGFYADLDFECFKSLDPLIHHELILSGEPTPHAVILERTTLWLSNALMASAPRNPFWLHCMNESKAKFYAVKPGTYVDPIAITGPGLVHAMVNKTKPSELTILSEDYFFPVIASWNIGTMRKHCQQPNEGHKLIIETFAKVCEELEDWNTNGRFTDNTYGAHRWHCSWCRAPDTTFLTLGEIFANFTSQVNISIYKKNGVIVETFGGYKAVNSTESTTNNTTPH